MCGFQLSLIKIEFWEFGFICRYKSLLGDILRLRNIVLWFEVYFCLIFYVDGYILGLKFYFFFWVKIIGEGK